MASSFTGRVRSSPRNPGHPDRYSGRPAATPFAPFSSNDGFFRAAPVRCVVHIARSSVPGLLRGTFRVSGIQPPREPPIPRARVPRRAHSALPANRLRQLRSCSRLQPGKCKGRGTSSQFPTIYSWDCFCGWRGFGRDRLRPRGRTTSRPSSTANVRHATGPAEWRRSPCCRIRMRRSAPR
jgi:hypothetical protein